MKSVDFGRCVFGCFVAAAMLAGCGGSQPPIGAPGAAPQTSAIATHAERGKSWMLLEAKNEDLIYAANGCGGTCVFSYSSGKYVGNLAASGGGLCSDSQGNVFITNDYTVTEFAHGGTTPIATLSVPGSGAAGCGVDPTTNNLAVVFDGSGVDVAVFPDEQGTPTTYATHLESTHCGYDDSGNLFVDGYDGHTYGFAELPRGATEFSQLSINQSVGVPGQVQWDGAYITYEGTDGHGTSIISRLSISGSEATIVGTTSFNIKHRAFASWISGHAVIIPYIVQGRVRGNSIGVWQYPNGGNEKHNIHSFGSYKKRTLDFQGVTLSVQS